MFTEMRQVTQEEGFSLIKDQFVKETIDHLMPVIPNVGLEISRLFSGRQCHNPDQKILLANPIVVGGLFLLSISMIVIYCLVKNLQILKGYAAANQKDSYGFMPLHHKVRLGSAREVKSLLHFGADVNAPDPNGWTPLHLAIVKGDPEIVKLLLAQEGVDVNAVGEYGYTPLHRAVGRIYPEIVKLLLAQEGVDVNEKNQYGDTPLHRAVPKGAPEMVKLFLDQEGVDVNARDQSGFTPLHVAIREGDPKIVKLFLAKEGVDFNARDPQGKTPILLLIEHNKLDVIKFIYRNGKADPNVVHENRTNLLMYAAQSHLGLVKYYMRQHGLNPFLPNDEGKTPEDFARAAGKHDIADFLREITTRPTA